MKKVLTAVLCMILAACSSRESAQFAPPRFVSATSEVTGRNAVTLHCTLSDGRVESCGILYGRDGKLNKRVNCDLNEDSFDITISELAVDVIYTWCAFATAGKAEIQSSPGTFRTSKRDPVPVEDPAFLNYLLQNHDYDRDGVFGYGDADRVKRISINPADKYGLQSLRGIEFMPNLEELYVDNCLLSVNLDVSANARLMYLHCENTGVTYLNLSNNPDLIELFCIRNYLTSLDVSNCTKLRRIQCWDNNIGALDVSGLTDLELLECADCGLTSLDVTHNPKLWKLSVNNNNLGSINLSANPLLEELAIWNCGLSALDISANPEMTWLRCWGNQITTLNVSNNLKLGSRETSITDDNGLWCAPMNTLKYLLIAEGQVIPNVTENRCDRNIPAGTIITIAPSSGAGEGSGQSNETP